MRHTLSCVFSALLLVLPGAGPAIADELRLINGDRYTGTVLQLSGDTLTFETSHGALSVPWMEVSALTVDDTIVVTTRDGAEVTLAGGAIDPAATTALRRPRPPLEITGGAGAGLVVTGGNSSVSSLRLDGDAVLRMRDNRYTFAGGINRSDDRGARTAQNWTASGRYDRFLSSRIFINANAIFTNDRFRDLELRSAYGAGLGYQIIDRPLIRLNVDAGVGYVNEDFGMAEDDSYAAVRESGKLDFIVIADRVVLFHQHDGYFGVTGTENFFIQAQNGLRFTVVAGLITTLRLDLDYDRSPAPGRESIDRTFALTLGYRF